MKPMFAAWTAGTVMCACASTPAEPTTPVDPAPAAADPEPIKEVDLHPELPQVRTRADLEQQPGQRVVIHGEYWIARTRGRIHPVDIGLSDGTILRRASDLVRAEEHLQGKRVIVVGTVTFDGPEPALTVESVEAAPQ